MSSKLISSKFLNPERVEERRTSSLLHPGFSVSNKKGGGKAEIKGPSGKIGLPKVTSNTDGTINLKYHPTEAGLHEIDIKFEKEPVQGSPYQFYVDRIKDSNITAWGPGLSYGQANEACNFTVVTKDGQAGGLDTTVEGPSKTEITCHDNKDGSCGVTYVPNRQGVYKVNVKFNNKHISGSPFTVKITGEGSKRSQLASSANEISLAIDIDDIKSLRTTITTPAGVEDVCLVRALSNGNIGVSFTPHEVGQHLINIRKGGDHIKDSPFKVDIKQSDLGDASKVKVSGPALKVGQTQESNKFTVDTKTAGYGNLSVSLEGPSRAEIDCHDNHDGTSDFFYVVKQPGQYSLNLRFADNHVPGSPFSIKVQGKGSDAINEAIKKNQKAAESTHVDSQCELNLKLLDCDPFDLTAQVTSPSGTIEDCEIINLNEGKFSIRFKAKELGQHSISVKIKGNHIKGSPLPFTVGEIVRNDGGTGAHKVKAYGPGLEQAEANRKTDFNITTHEAGQGTLGVMIQGPGKSDIQYEDLGNGCAAIEYVCKEVGEYIVNVTFNDKAVPDSPFHVFVAPPMGDAHKITVSALEERVSAAILDKPVTFNVNMNGVKGHLDAKVVGPSGQEDDCALMPSGPDSYMVRFVPKMKGTHYVNVKFNHVHIRHSPFRIRVGKDIEGDPVKVHVSGTGLTHPKLNVMNEFMVNTADSGAGVLAVNIDGPSKAEVSFKEEAEGYKVMWLPKIPGNYYLAIKFSGHHITGSPFKTVVEGKKPPGHGDRRESTALVVETVTKTSSNKSEISLPKFHSDATKVETRGIGLQKAFINKQNSFNVNCSKAGQDMLTINVWGPTGPCQEICVRNIGGSQFLVSYIVIEKGDLFLVVKYGDKDVPGSPFHMKVI